MKNSINIVNKKAKFEYEFIQVEVAGIKLKGSEVKAIRMGKASISEGYCYFVKGELFIKGMNISDYGYGSTHETVVDRKLLLKKKELKPKKKTKTVNKKEDKKINNNNISDSDSESDYD